MPQITAAARKAPKLYISRTGTPLTAAPAEGWWVDAARRAEAEALTEEILGRLKREEVEQLVRRAARRNCR